MLKNRVLAALAIGSLTVSPALAKDTRASQSLPPASAKGSPQAQERLALLFEVAGTTCDAPGNGKKTGHENSNGKGHEFAPGKGHACDGASPG